ncbi:ArnT family glycosyltransferase [Paracoccus sp. p4-l81]|uniref:ArnT family glycosyltransferase n=1 Tax=unclassified Paracoccus (in: a-proteobacteria) TaxID=2688777 RepID=UPI0035BB5441
MTTALPRLRLALLALAAAVLFLPGLASLPVTDRDEARFVQASRQMVQDGNPVDIRFQDVARLNKPVGIYWLQAAAALASGRRDRAPLWVWRLPSVIGAVAVVVLVAVIGAPLVGAGPAMMGAALMAVSLVLTAEARIAKTDAVLLALTLAMMLPVARLHLGQAGARLAWGFWLAFAAAVLVKGPMGPLIVGLTLAALSALRRDLGWLRPLARPLPMLAAAALVLPWLVAVTWRSGGAFWAASVGHDLLAKVASGVEGKGLPPGSYLLAMGFSFWPGAVLVPMALAGVWRRRGQPGVAFLLAWLIPGWLMFEAVPTKLIHYPMPLYPALSLLAASAWLGGLPVARGARLAAMLLVPVGPLILAALIWWGWPQVVAPGIGALAMAVALSALAWVAIWRDRRDRAAALLVALGAVVMTGLVITAARLPVLWPSTQAYVAGQAATGCPAPHLIGAGYNEPSLVWLGGRKTRLIADDAPVPLPLPPCSAVIRPAGLPPLPGLIATARISGFALGAGRAVTLDILTPEVPK